MPAILEGYISVPGAEIAGPTAAAPGSRPSAVSSNLRMWLPLVGLGLGILLGLLLNVSVSPELARYTAVAILAGLDSILGAVRAELDGHYDNRIFLSGFVANTAVAVVLTFVGDRLGIDLYLVALIAFGLRIFQNVALIRRHFL
jgi:small basic protein